MAGEETGWETGQGNELVRQGRMGAGSMSREKDGGWQRGRQESKQGQGRDCK